MSFPFVLGTSSAITLVSGMPDCQAGHNELLRQLAVAVNGTFLAINDPLNERRKGNLGEFAALVIGRKTVRADVQCIPANPDPLSDISKPDIDIVWLHFHPTDPGQDFVSLQETKTTGDPSLEYAAALVDDYAKLFGLQPRHQLQVRLQAIKWQLELSGREDLCLRIVPLAGRSPQTSTCVRLVPTLVHEMTGADPVRKMGAVRTTLIAAGWSPHQVEAWSIALTDLNDRFERLSRGLP